MDEILTQHAQVYARRHNLRLAERLGHGIHGIVYGAERDIEPGMSRSKCMDSRDAYERERNVYLRLRGASVEEILGFNLLAYLTEIFHDPVDVSTTGLFFGRPTLLYKTSLSGCLNQ